jgi:hypothetical protein
MKRFAMILLAAATLVGGIGIAGAQARHGGSQGGGATTLHSAGGNWRGGNWHGGNWRGGDWRGGGWHGSRVAIGVGFGAPWWGWGGGWWPGYYASYPAYYPAYPYYADYPYSYDYTAPTYIQQDAPAYPQNAPAYTERRFSQDAEYSYYCPDPAGYYPQVQTCAKGWLRVLPPGAPGPDAPVTR